MKKPMAAALLYIASIAIASASGVTGITTASSMSGYAPESGAGFGVPVFVRGEFNGWGLANEMAFNGVNGDYTATITIDTSLCVDNDAGCDFKIASEDWSTVDLGNVDGVAPFSVPPTVTVNAARTSFGNFNLLSSGTYLFTLDAFDFTGNDGPYELTISQIPVPVPAAVLLLCPALLAMGWFRRR